MPFFNSRFSKANFLKPRGVGGLSPLVVFWPIGQSNTFEYGLAGQPTYPAVFGSPPPTRTTGGGAYTANAHYATTAPFPYLGPEFTIDLWANSEFTSARPETGLVSRYGSTPGSIGWALTVHATDGISFLVSSDGTLANSVRISGGAFPTSPWKKITARFRAGQDISLHMNNNLIASSTLPPSFSLHDASSSTPVRVSSWKDDTTGANRFEAYIADVRIFRTYKELSEL